MPNKNRLKGFTPVIVLILFFIAAIGYIVYKSVTNKVSDPISSTPTPTIQAVVVATATPSSKPTPTKSPVVNSVKNISFAIPTGWTTFTDKSNIYQLSFDPSKLKTCYQNNEGITLCTEFGTYIDSSVEGYNYGGSRHERIYAYGLGGAPKKDELWSDYYETDYNFDGKSCLILNGISSSQYPAVWGMCVLDQNRTFMFTSYDRDEGAYLPIIKSFKLLK